MITLPIWVFLLMLVLACWSAWSRLFVPSVRWYLRRRVNALIDQVNRRLDVRIRPFQLAKRKILLQRLVYDAEVVKAQEDYVIESNLPRDVVHEKVRRYAQEIVPAFNAYLYYRFGYWLAKKVVQWLYDVRVTFSNEKALLSANTNSTIVFVMNHRSNMDYVLVSFLASQRTTLSYAVGEWARVWPLEALIKSMGAYFVRRNSRNPLYRKVLERYVAMATKEGVCQAMFPEGGLTRDGKLRAAKLGLFDYMLRHFDHDKDPDVLFIPVGINYDRTLEDRTLLKSLDGDAPKTSKWQAAGNTLAFVKRNLGLMWRHQWKNFGHAAVVFGTPISAADYAKSQSVQFHALDRALRFHHITQLSEMIMSEVASVVPVLPLAVLCEVLLASKEPLDRISLKVQALKRSKYLTEAGLTTVVAMENLDGAYDSAIDMLVKRRLVMEEDQCFAANPQEHLLLNYYANSIVHLEK